MSVSLNQRFFIFRFICHDSKSFVMSTAACTAVAFVAGALAWWGPKFIALGLATQQGHQDVSLDEYVNFHLNSFDLLDYI